MSKFYHFEPGEIFMTRGIQEAAECKRFNVGMLMALGKHANGQFPEDDKHDLEANRQAVESGDRVFTAWKIQGKSVFIITDGRQPGIEATTDTHTVIMLASEY